MSKDLSSLITIQELKKSIEITIHEKKIAQSHFT